MLSVLSDTQKAIVEVMTMRLLAPQSLEYLKNAGHEMSRSKYFPSKEKDRGNETRKDALHCKVLPLPTPRKNRQV